MGTLGMLQCRSTMTSLHGESRSQEVVEGFGAGTRLQLMQPRVDSRDLASDVTHKA